MSRRAMMIGGAALIAVVLVWYLALWSPRQSAIAKQRERAQAAEQQRSELEVSLSRLQGLKKDEALKRSQLDRLRVAIPEQPNLAQFILDANDAADKAGIEFLSITPALPTASASGGAASVGLAMTISGGYFQVLDYLNRLDELPRIVVVDSINVTPSAGDRADELSVALTGKMFSTGVPATAPATASPTSPSGAAAATPPGAVGVTTTTVPGVAAPAATAGAVASSSSSASASTAGAQPTQPATTPTTVGAP
jgi:Tfp pilus assembly protein PilO